MKKHIYLTLIGIFSGWGLFAQISTFPDVDDFESESTCGTSCSGSCNPVGNWKNADQFSFPQAGTDWLVLAGSTPSTATGPDVDHTTNTASGKCMYTETSGCNNITAHLVSVIYDFSALTNPKIKFWYHMYGATMGTMHLDVDTTGLGDWVLDVVPAWTDNQNLWQLKDVSIAGTAAGRPSVRIRIRAITGTSFTSDMAVDDIEVYQPAANDINLFSVTAGGGCGNSVNTPVIVKMINGGTNLIPIGTIIPVAFEINSVIVVDTLINTVAYNPNDTFAFTFNNGYADLSGPGIVQITAWSAWPSDLQHGNDTATVATQGIPIIATYPYFEDFEAGQNGWVIHNGTSGTWAFGTPAKSIINSASSGANAFVNGGLTGFYNDNETSYVEGPCFDFSNICDPVISLRVWWNAEFSWDGMNITISTDGGQTWNMVGNYGDPLGWYTDNTIVGNPGGYQSGWSGRTSTSNGSGGWITASHLLNGAGNMANVKIRINFGSDGSVTDDGVAFDDIHIFNGTDLGANQTICSPSTATLNAYYGNPTDTYLWSTGETTPTITASTTGWYSVAITSSVSCTVTDSVYIAVVDANSAIALGADTSTCNTPVALDAGYWPESTYLWSTGATTQTISANTTGTYSVDVTTPCGTLSDAIVVNVNPLPVVNLGSDSSFCGSATLVAGNGTDTYLWNTSATTPTLNVTNSGTYDVQVTNSQGCMNSDTIAVTVNALPVLSITGTTSICSGLNTTLVASGATSYSWMNGPSTSSFTVAPISDSTFVVMGTDGNGCSNSDSVLVTVNSLPVVDLGNDSTQCGGTVMLDAGAFSSYLWNNGDLTQTSNITSSGLYYVMVTDSNGCSNNDTVMVTINPIPAVNIGNDVTQCGGSATLDAGSFSSYNWSNGDQTQTSVISTTGTYSVVVTDANGCQNSDTATVTINTPPTVTLALTFSNVCVDDASYALSGGTPAGGTYSGIGVSGLNFSPGTAGVGMQVITYTYNDVNGCSDSATQVVNVSACVGYQENFADAVMSVYPNPSQGVFTLELNGLTANELSLMVVDAMGRTVLEEKANVPANTFRTDLDLSKLDNGIYFLVLKSGDSSKTVKLVLNK